MFVLEVPTYFLVFSSVMSDEISKIEKLPTDIIERNKNY